MEEKGGGSGGIHILTNLQQTGIKIEQEFNKNKKNRNKN